VATSESSNCTGRESAFSRRSGVTLINVTAIFHERRDYSYFYIQQPSRARSRCRIKPSRSAELEKSRVCERIFAQRAGMEELKGKGEREGDSSDG